VPQVLQRISQGAVAEENEAQQAMDEEPLRRRARVVRNVFDFTAEADDVEGLPLELKSAMI